MSLKRSKINALTEYIEKDGEQSLEAVAKLLELEVTDEDTIHAYIRKVQKERPDLFKEKTEEEDGDEDLDEVPQEKKGYTLVVRDDKPVYRLLNSDNTISELELVSNKGGKITFEVVRPKDLVTVIIKGQPVEVDALHVANLPVNDTSVHGVPAAKLMELIQYAR